MLHPIYQIQTLEILDDYKLHLRFNDHSEQTIDFAPVLAGDLYGPLRDLNLFKQVKIDPEVHTLVWPNGADFDPAMLHDWPQYAHDFAARAQQWRVSPTKRLAQ